MGKTVALKDGVDFAIATGHNVVIDLGADGLPEIGSIDLLLKAVEAPGVGGASARQIPLQAGSRLAFLIDDVISGTWPRARNSK